MKAAYPDLKSCGTFYVEDYLSARIVGEGPRRTKDVTPAGLAKSLQAMGEVDREGYRIDFPRATPAAASLILPWSISKGVCAIGTQAITGKTTPFRVLGPGANAPAFAGHAQHPCSSSQ